MKRIAVISDTHGRLDSRVDEVLASSGASTIVHAGDIGDPWILDQLAAYGDVHAVLGNNDYADYGPSVGAIARFTVDGVRFLVAHYPREARISPRTLAPGELLPHVCIHGHTHVPEIVVGKDASPATMIFCPGSAFRPRGGTPRAIGFIEVEDGRVLNAWVQNLEGARLLEWPS